jgi:hypothetical protein
MGLPRSTYYDAPAVKADDGEIVAAMATICDEFEAYGYRRVGAELRHRGMIVNSKKVRRLMREYDLQPKRRRRFVATTDSDHDCPIFPDLARDRIIDGPNQLWVADITYIAIATSFVYLAAVLDAWSRRFAPPKQMLRCDVVPSRHFRHDYARLIGFRDYSALDLIAPPAPTANPGANINAAASLRSVNYMVNHICEPIQSRRTTSSGSDRTLQDGDRAPLTVMLRWAAI